MEFKLEKRRASGWATALLLSTAFSALGFAAAADLSSTPPAIGAGTVDVLQVRPDVYMLTARGVNVALYTGPDGAVVINAGPSSTSAEVLAAIRKLAPQPIRFVIDTSGDADVVGGNGTLAAAGQGLSDLDPLYNGVTAQFGSAIDLPGAGEGSGAGIIARQGVLTQMSGSAEHYPSSALPTELFTRAQFNFRLNDGEIEVVSVPSSHTDSDCVVRLDRQDVVVTGPVFDQTRFPVIDVAHGGSIQGELDALDQIVNTLVFGQVPVLSNTGGTLVIPMRGELSDQDDVLAYRDMLAIIQARVRYYIRQGKTLKQLLDADPAAGYRSRYGSDHGDWTTDDFIRAVYQSVSAELNRHPGKKS